MAALLVLAPGPVVAASPPVQAVEVTVRRIEAFHVGDDATTFGRLEFVGGLEMSSRTADFGALSAIRFLDAGQSFIGVADTGFWFFGTLLRDAEGQPSGVAGLTMQQMVDSSGRAGERKWEVDAEGLAVAAGVATIGFERDHRVAQYRIDPADMAGPLRELDFLIPVRELRSNRGFETVAHDHGEGAGPGPLVIVSEKSLDRNGNIFAAIVDGPGKGVFTVRRNGEFDITDGAFLPGGDLLLLERSFSIASGVRMRLRRVQGASIAKGRVADGPVLFEAGMDYQIDNMEGLDVWTRADGALMVSIISDDNHSMLQRNLYLEFVLHPD